MFVLVTVNPLTIKLTVFYMYFFFTLSIQVDHTYHSLAMLAISSIHSKQYILFTTFIYIYIRVLATRVRLIYTS